MGGEKRIRIITGHYGSGKTEFAVNFALGLSKQGNKTAIVDIDIVNPYFRTRELEELFSERGIRLIASTTASPFSDIPSLSPEIFAAFQDKDYQVVIDIGGDGAGANALGRFHTYLDKEPFEMYFVINANRRKTKDLDSTMKCLQSIEAGSRQKVTALVCNTHMCGETTIRDVKKGYELCLAVSEATGLPLRYTVAEKRLIEYLPPHIKSNSFPINLYLLKPWEK